MAELNTKQVVAGKKGRLRKVAPKVDLTAMVDLAFLLITFFMLTTSLNKPNSLDLAVPDKSENSIQDMDERRIVSLVIQEGKLTCYHGDINKPLQDPIHISLENNNIRSFLLEMSNKIKSITDGKDIIVLLKPSREARTSDIVRTLDEMKISNIKRYLLSKATKEDESLLL